ncbi:MAG TPA: transglycosylase domain-containing protein, partial [Kofleriaceae bacterium]
MACRIPLASRVLFLALFTASAAAAGDLETELGRNESRIYAAPFVIPTGAKVADLALPERLERLGYHRVHDRPDAAGQYFHGSEVFWVYRRSCHAFGADRPSALFGLDLGRGGTVVGVRLPDGSRRSIRDDGDAWLEPELLAESLAERRAVRTRIALESLPERVWRPVLAAEDARFFEHTGVDPRAVARAALRNLMAGRVAQGGSTITQQLIKNRDLGPERTLGRKASEAMRALALEAAYDKREILQAYLNSVYLGHVDGLAVHGIGTAARVYFSKPAANLSLAEAAALAAMIQGPNRLSPTSAASALRSRRDWVLSRMAELGWASKDEAARAKAQGLGAKLSSPRAPGAPQFVAWVAQEVSAEAGEGRGYLVETTLDPWLQRLAERAVAARLETLRKSYPRSRSEMQAALVALDGRTGEVLAYVGGDPAAPGFDRVRSAKRQPGSVVKPFVALEAIERCGSR